MIVITQRQMIESVVQRWKDTYGADSNVGRRLETFRALQKLDLKTATAEEVDKIIGNNHWTTCLCHECRQHVTDFIRVGTTGIEFDDGSTFNICHECLHKAFALVQ